MCFCFGPADGWPGVGEQPQLEGSSGSISGTHSTPRPLSQAPPHWVLSPHTKGPCMGEQGLPGASSFRTPTLSQSLGRSVALQVQEAGRRAADQMEPEVRVQTVAPPPNPGAPLLQCLLPESALRAPSLTPAPFSLHPPLFTSPHFPVFSPSLPLCSPPGWVSESYGEPGDRPGFILGKSIHDRGYHSNKLPWCLDTR